MIKKIINAFKKKIIRNISFFLILIIALDSLNNLHDKKKEISLKIDNLIFNKANKNIKSDKYWAEEVVKGGYILHFRHTQREKWNDVTGFDALELSEKIKAENSSFNKATCLTARGIEEAKLIKNIFENLNVQVSKVLSSPSCRARMTSKYAFGRIDQITNSLLHRTAMTPKQDIVMAKQLKKIILNLDVKKNKNIILSGHGGTIEDNYDGRKVIDTNNVGNLARDEGGFVIIEKKGNKLIAHHKFKNFSKFINSLVEFPIN